MKLNKKGFTLVELIVVIAIVAVLTAIGIPVISGQVTKAKDDAAAVQIASIRSAFLTAVAENDIILDKLKDNTYIDYTKEPKEIDIVIANRMDEILGTTIKKQYAVHYVLDTNKVSKGTLYIYYTDKPAPLTSKTKGVYTYINGVITKK